MTQSSKSRGAFVAAAVHLMVFGAAAVIAYFGGPGLGLPDGTSWVLLLVALIGLPFAVMLGRNPQGLMAPAEAKPPSPGKRPLPERKSPVPPGSFPPSPAPSGAVAPPTHDAQPIEGSHWGRTSPSRSLELPEPPPPEQSPEAPTRTKLHTPPAVRESSAASTGPPSDPRMVVVLPFSVTGDDPTIEYVAEGIAEEVLFGLGRLPGARVPARGSTFLLSESDSSPLDIGRALGAAHVLHATISRDAHKLSLSATLIRTKDGVTVWESRLDGELDSIGKMQNEVISEVAAAAGLAGPDADAGLTSGRLTTVAEAQDHYLQGRYHWHHRGDGLRRSAEHFERAIHADPDFALGHAGKADANMLLGFYGYMEPKAAFHNATHAAERALELDDQIPEAWTALGFVRSFSEWDWARAEVSFKRAVDLNPSYVTARFWYAMSLGVRGRPSDWVRHNLTASRSDPVSVYADAHLGWALLIGARAFEQAEERFHSALQRDRDFSLGYWFRGRAKLHQGKVEAAIEDLEEGARRSRGNPLTLATLAYAVAQNGDESGAERQLQNLRAGPTGWRWVRASQIATIELGLGRSDEALTSLSRAVDERDFWLPLTVMRPEWDEYRGDARFAEVLDRIGLAEVDPSERQVALEALTG